MKNLLEAMFLRGYKQIDTGDGRISFRRIDDEENKGDTQGWVFQYDNWDAVRESLIYTPLWEDKELTTQIFNLLNLSLEERYTKAMELAGYEKTEVKDVFGVYTVAFKNKKTEELIQTEGWEMLGNELEKIKPLSETDIKTFDYLIHPEERISFYCKNLGGTGLGVDMENVSYPDFDSAIKAYLSAETDGRMLGYKIGDIERVITYFDTVYMQHQYIMNINKSEFYENLTFNEKQFLKSTIEYASAILNENNVYQTIYEGICTVAHKCAADISVGKTEWGSWGGHIVNSRRPQDYIDVDIMGYVTTHKVICNINVIHGNEIVSEKSVTIKIEPENLEISVRNGITNAINELDSYIHEATKLLDTDYTASMHLYSPYTFRTLEEHYLALNDVGYTTFPVIKKDFRLMTHEDMKNYIQHFLKKNEPELICTSRVLDSLATSVIKLMNTGQIVEPHVEVNELLVKDSILNFIKERIPLVEKVSNEVQASIKEYFEEYLKGFTPIEICRASNHPEDNDLYAVIAKKTNGEYACWTSWHQKKESMNFGHYGLPDREEALSIIKENFNDISGELRKYGPEQSLVIVQPLENIEKQWNQHKDENTKSIVVPFVNKSRGR